MDIHVLGCHGPFPGANGATSGYLLVSGGHRLLIDCGAGVLGKLAAKMDPAALDGVLLSHLHYDHMSDALVLQYQLQAAGKRPAAVCAAGGRFAPAGASVCCL